MKQQEQALRLSLVLLQRKEKVARILSGWTGMMGIGLKAQVWIRRELGQRLELVLRPHLFLGVKSPNSKDKSGTGAVNAFKIYYT
jgi:hypothetical protein